MTQPKSPQVAPRRKRHRWLVIIPLVLMLGAGWAWFYLTRPHRLAAYASGVLRQMYRGTEPTIESARFNLHGEIELTNLRLSVQGLPGPAGEVFRAERALLWVDPATLLSGRPQVRAIVVEQPVLSITQVEQNRFNIDALRELASRDTADKVIPRLPRIQVHDGAIRYGEVVAGEYHEQGKLQLAGNLEPDEKVAALYHFNLAEHRADLARPIGARLSGRFNLNDLSVSARMSQLTLANPHRNMLPRQVRDWWDRLDPVGAISGVSFEYSEAQGPKAQLQVKGVALTIPQLSKGDFKARMTDVSGTFRFEGERMHIDGLVGRIEDIQYQIDGTIQGYSPDAPFELWVSTQPFRIPDEPRYMLAMPSNVQKLFRMFSPSGWVSARATSRRAQAGGLVDVRGEVRVLNGGEVLEALRAAGRDMPGLSADSPELVSRGRFSHFPYEVTNVRGLVTFTEESVELRDLRADAGGGGTMVVNGTVAPLNDEAAVDITIDARSIPLDEKLYEAMGPRRRPIVELFFHAQSWRRLHDRGHFVSSHDPAGDAAKPAFDLGGSFSGTVKITGDGRRPGYEVDVGVAGARALFGQLPYPVQITGGRVRITRQRIDLDNVLFSGLHGGTGGIVGHILMPDGAGGHATPRLGIHGKGFPVDDLLLDALDPRHAAWLRGMHLTGSFDLEGTLFRDDEADRIDADLNVLLTGGEARPGGGAYDLQDIRAALTVSVNKVQIDSFAATHGESTLSLTGEADWSDPDHPIVKLHATCKSMRFEDPIPDLVAQAGPLALSNAEGARPEPVEGESAQSRVLDLWKSRQPTGVFDAELDYESQRDGKGFKVVVSPASLAFNYAGHRVGLTGTTGQIIAEPHLVRVDAFCGDYDGGRLTVSGTIPISNLKSQISNLKSEISNPTFSISAVGERVTPTLLQLLPARVAAALTAARFEGRYDLNIPSLTLTPEGLDFSGTVKVAGASCRLGVPITDVHAALDVATTHAPAPGYSITVRTDRLRVVDRLVESLSMTLNADREGAASIEDIRARCADGRIIGDGRVTLGNGEFQLNLALADAELAQLSTKPQAGTARPEPVEGARPEPVEGESAQARVSASLNLEGAWDDPQRFRGQGTIAVRDAQLRGVPLAMDLLRVSHLMLPVTTAFDSANVSYYLLHDRVVFEAIELSAPTMRLAGSGRMSLPRQALDITLTTSNPRGLDLGPITDLIAKVRDQLVTIHITGTLDKPITKVQQFRGITDAIDDVLGKRPPKKAKP